MADLNDNDQGNDSLGSSFLSSFSLPPPSPKEPAISPDPTPTVAKAEASAPAPPTESAPAPVGEDWKEALEKNLKVWQAESSVARQKSEATRLRIEQERAKEAADAEAAKKAKARKEKEAEEERKIQEKVQAVLAGNTVKSGKGKAKDEGKDGRWAEVRDAWEIVKDGKTAVPAEDEEVEVDGRDMTAGDEGGKAGNEGPRALAEIHAATQAVTGSRPSVPPTSGPVASTSQSASFPAELPAETLEENNELIPSPYNGPPSQPPSLTLSLFTMPSRRTVLRIAAVMGINLVLPFINGVMLGFGEIFARETFGWGRRWWRGEVLFRGTTAAATVGLTQAATQRL